MAQACVGISRLLRFWIDDSITGWILFPHHGLELGMKDMLEIELDLRRTHICDRIGRETSLLTYLDADVVFYKIVLKGF